MTMECKVSHVNGLNFMGKSNSGHGVVISAKASDGDETIGASPMELLLLGAGGCASVDVVMILEKGKVAFDNVECIVTGERADEVPKVFTKIHLHFQITGRDLPENKVQRAVQLSAEKYCSASITLSKAADVTHSYEIIDPAA